MRPTDVPTVFAVRVRCAAGFGGDCRIPRGQLRPAAVNSGHNQRSPDCQNGLGVGGPRSPAQHPRPGVHTPRPQTPARMSVPLPRLSGLMLANGRPPVGRRCGRPHAPRRPPPPPSGYTEPALRPYSCRGSQTRRPRTARRSSCPLSSSAKRLIPLPTLRDIIPDRWTGCKSRIPGTKPRGAARFDIPSNRKGAPLLPTRSAMPASRPNSPPFDFASWVVQRQYSASGPSPRSRRATPASRTAASRVSTASACAGLLIRVQLAFHANLLLGTFQRPLADAGGEGRFDDVGGVARSALQVGDQPLDRLGEHQVRFCFLLCFRRHASSADKSTGPSHSMVARMPSSVPTMR